MGAARRLPGLSSRLSSQLSSRLLPGSGRLTRAAAEELRAREALAARLVQVSHDLRGALSPALLVADALREHGDAAVVRAGEAVARTVERATALAHELVALAHDGAPRDGAPLDAADATAEASDGYQP